MKALFALSPLAGIVSLRSAAARAALAGGLALLGAAALPAQSPVDIARQTNAKAGGAAPKSAADAEATSASASQVIARVNGTPITAGQRDDETQKLMFEQLRMLGGNMNGISPDQMQTLREKSKETALQNLVDVELIKQAKEKSGIKANDADIKAGRDEMMSYIKDNGMTYEQFLASNGMTEADVTKALSERVEIKKMLEARTGALDPSEEQEKAFYEQNKDKMNRPETVRSSHILIKFPGDPRDAQAKPPTDPEKAEARKKAEEVMAKVKAGGDFAALAAQYSDDPGSKVKGGDIGPQAKGALVKPYEDAIWTMKAGELSPIVESQFGYHIIKVTEHNEAGVMKFDEVKTRIKDVMFQQRFTDAMTSLKEELHKTAKVEMLEKQTASAPAAASGITTGTMPAPLTAPAKAK